MPIFAGRLEVERLRLVRPQLALERRDGKANWQLQASTPSEAAVEAAAPTEREDFPVLKHLTVRRQPDLPRYRPRRADRSGAGQADRGSRWIGGSREPEGRGTLPRDRKSTRLNSSH